MGNSGYYGVSLTQGQADALALLKLHVDNIVYYHSLIYISNIVNVLRFCIFICTIAYYFK